MLYNRVEEPSWESNTSSTLGSECYGEVQMLWNTLIFYKQLKKNSLDKYLLNLILLHTGDSTVSKGKPASCPRDPSGTSIRGAASRTVIPLSRWPVRCIPSSVSKSFYVPSRNGIKRVLVLILSGRNHSEKLPLFWRSHGNWDLPGVTAPQWEVNERTFSVTDS